MPTQEDFEQKFRGRMLVLLTEAWSCRKLPPTAVGLLLDDHFRRCKGLLEEMYTFLNQKQVTTDGKSTSGSDKAGQPGQRPGVAGPQQNQQPHGRTSG